MAEYTENEKALLEIKEVFERLFSSKDGETALEFLKQVTGYDIPLPLIDLSVAEGARRTTCLINVFSKPQNPRVFLDYCFTHLVDDKFLH